ncbi:MAG: hypothetical protein JSW07_11265, partial [bacterium]
MRKEINRRIFLKTNASSNFIFFISFFLFSTAFSQQSSLQYYQGITVPPSYSYHLSGRTDRVKGYLIKVDEKTDIVNPGLVILASGIAEGEGYVIVNGTKYDIPPLLGNLSVSIDKSEKNAPAKEGWYSYCSGDDIIGKIVVPIKLENLQNGINEITFYMNSESDGFEIIDTRIESVKETSPTLIGQTYHLLARGKPSSIRDFDFVFNYKGDNKR